jgi:hypothetical protein
MATRFSSSTYPVLISHPPVDDAEVAVEDRQAGADGIDVGRDVLPSWPVH